MPVSKAQLVTCGVLVGITFLYISISNRNLVGDGSFAVQKVAVPSASYQTQGVGHHEARIGDRVVTLRSDKATRERKEEVERARAAAAAAAAAENVKEASGKKGGGVSSAVKRKALAAARALYEGDFVEDPDFFFSECLRRDAPNICDLVRYTNESGVWTVDGSDKDNVKTLTRWVPSKPDAACPFKYYSQNDTLDLLRDMGIKKVHIMGDSMSRYFGFVFIGVLTHTRREQYTFHFDFNMLREHEVGVAVEFYWRETIESLHSAIDTGEAYICSGGDSLTLINNNLHQALLEQQLFVDLEHRYQEVKEVVEKSRRKCGDRLLWRGPNQVADFSRTWRGEDSNTLTFAEAIDTDAFKTLPRLSQELDVPILDVYSITDKAPQDCLDGMHYDRWELEHEVHVLLSQVECLFRTGYWGAPPPAGSAAAAAAAAPPQG